MSRVLFVLLLLSLVANLGAAWMVLKLYTDNNVLRLDPLQLAVYPDSPPLQGREPRVVLFGDSRALSWPAPAVPGLDFVNRGIGQQTSAQIALRFERHVTPLEPDLLVLQLCVNDLKVIPLVPEAQADIIQGCKQQLQAIIGKARLQGTEVLLTTVFPLGEVPLERRLFWSDAVAAAIREVNDFIRVQAGPGVHVLDTFALLQGEPDHIRPEYSRDLLHLNAAGYTVLNQALAAWLQDWQSKGPGRNQ
ncbi:MAG: SGNH/GDSL hydrolase family protein [Thiothrix sp.]|nr:SGNH/GDSL hydrolase family protein [Thiothrix sp.]HPE61124.1 SGNH/GDSL hydrolase family protein [Thiolinea sp.]